MSGDSTQSEATLSVWRKPPGLFRLVGLLAAAAYLLCGAPAVRADRSPANCTGSGLGISLFTSIPDVHVGDTLHYSVNVFNGAVGSPNIACDATEIQAFIVTPDGLTHDITPLLLRRTLLQGQSDFYQDVVSYVVRAQDIQPDGTLLATARDTGVIHQNDVNSVGGGFQGVNTQVNMPCVLITALCVAGVGENGLITFSGTVTNCGNNTLVGVTVTNFNDAQNFTVVFPTNLATGQSVTFTGGWIPANPCIPSSAILTVRATDEFTATPRTITNFTTITCQNTTTPGIKVTKTCPAGPVSPGQLLTFSGSVSNTGNITLTNIVVVNSQPAANTPVFTLPSLAPGVAANFTGSYLAPTNCSVADTLTATATSRCGVGVSSVASATCPILTTPAIVVTATCPVTPVVPGASLTYTGTVRNTGNITLNDVVVTSDRPAPNTTVFTAASLAPGAVAGFTSSVTVPANACSVTTTFSGTGKDSCTLAPVTSTVSTTCTAATAPAIAVTLVCPTVPASTGGQITYTGTVSNPGNVTLNNVTVVNNQAVPSTVLTVLSLAPGASANFTASFTAPTNACSVSSTVTATGTDNCTATAVTNTASATCPLVTTPALAVTQTCPVNPVVPGGLLTYNGTVQNTGNITLTNVVVLNNLSGGTPVFTTATLAPGAIANFTGSYLAPTNCSSTSIATATGRSTCGVAVTGTVSTTCPILTTPQIAVTAVCPPTPVVPGASLTYSGTVRNTGNITLTNVVVVSDRPAANTTVFTVAALAPGASANFTSSVTTPANACSVTTIFSGIGRDLCTLNAVTNTVATTCTSTTAPAIAVTLACPPVSASTGGQITYTGAVSNPGNVTLNNVFVVNNHPGPNTPVIGPITLTPGASANFTTSFTAPTDACSVSSTVVATGTDNCSAVLVTNTASATCPLITTPGLAINQTCPINPVVPGGLLTYNATVQNTGNITLTNVVVTSADGITPPPSNTVTTTLWFDDALPAGAATAVEADSWTWVSSNPAPFSGSKAHQSDLVAGMHQHYFTGAAALAINTGDVLVVYVYLDPAHAPSQVILQWYDGSWAHRASWGADLFGPWGTVHHMGALPAVGQWVRLEVPASVVGLEGHSLSGMSFTLYDGRATWDAAGKATGITVPLPPSGTPVFTTATLAPGAITNFVVNYTVPASGVCSFTSTLMAGAADPCTGTPVTANVSTTCPLLTTPAIVVTQACPPTPVMQGGILTYSGTVRNAGNVTLTNIVVVNNWPIPDLVVFTAASLAPGETMNFTGSYQVPGNCCVAWSTVQARGQGCDGVMVTDTDSGTCTVLTAPQIVVTKVCPPTAVRPGDLLTYSGNVSNAGNIALLNVTVVNNQPGPGTLLLGPFTLAPGESIPYTASYIVPADFCGNDTVTASGLDGCSYAPVVKSVATACPILTTPRIAVTKHCPLQPTPHGGTLTFSGTVSNPGNVTLTNVFVVNNQPTNNTPVIGPITLAPGAFFDFTGSYIVPPLCCEMMDTLTARGQDRCSSSNVTATATAICPLLYMPGIALVQSCPPNPLAMGSLYSFSGFVTNTGDAILTNVVVFTSQAGPSLPLLGPLTLAPGEWESYTGSMTVPFNSCAAIVTVTSQETCKGTWVTNTTSCPVANSPQITLTQTCPVAPVTRGGLLTYSGSVSNAGNITLVNIVVTNSQSGNTPVFTVTTLDPGASTNFTGSYIVPATGPSTSTSTVHAMNSCGTQVTNTASSTCLIGTPGITVSKLCPPQPVAPGGILVFTGTAANTGTVTLTNVFVVNNQPVPNTPVLGPITLAPGAVTNFTRSYLVPLNVCVIADTLTVTGNDASTGLGLTNTISATCPTLTTPGIAITQTCPPGPVSAGDSVVFSGLVSNTGDITLTNIFVIGNQPTNDTPLLGPITLAPGASAPYTGSYLATGGANPTTNTTIVTNLSAVITTNVTTVVTTNSITPTFGTIDPVLGILTDRFNVPAGLHGLMYADQDENWGPTLFYSTRQPASGADQFVTISTISSPTNSIGLVTDRFSLTSTNYDALTLAAPDVGYGSVNFYYLRHGSPGVSTFGVIKAAGASSSADLPVSPLAGTGYTGLAFAAADVGAYGGNLFYYIRTNNAGLATFGTLDPTPGLSVTDRYGIGSNLNYDSMVFVPGAVSTWGTAIFAYLRHDNTGSIIGTIDPVTQLATDRLSLGTNLLSALTFTATDVGYGPNLFYYLLPERTILTTNVVTSVITNTVFTFVTNSVVTFTPTNTVTATGRDICQGRGVGAAASCAGPVAPDPQLIPSVQTPLPVIGAPSLANGFFNVPFPTENGVLYTLQYKNALSDPTWTDLETIIGTGGILSFTDPNAGQYPTRFYRIIATP